MFIVKKNNTILDSDDKVIFYSYDEFMKEIVESDNCFICGKSSKETDFNDEHIIPNWVLREFNLHSQFITLPNGAKIKYGEYTIPCCVKCNSNLSENFEVPISKLLKKNYDEIISDIQKSPKLIGLLFKWLNLIFLKTHLKDNTYRYELNRSIESGSIGDEHYWSDMHHIHCIARSFYTEAVIEKECLGSIGIFKVKSENDLDNFDYADSPAGKGIFFQFGEIGIISVLNDACAVSCIMHDTFHKIGSPLIPEQCKEILAHFNYLNLSLANPPNFSSNIGLDMKYHITVKKDPEINLIPVEERFVSIGGFMRYYFTAYYKNHPDKERLLKELEEEKRSFLWNEKGEFNHII
jgi:hypothetical protein